MNPWDGFNPLDPQQLIGSADPAQLLAAAARFPGGAAALIFALFFAPAEMPVIYLFAGLLPGIPAALLLAGVPAGVVLAQHSGINPLVTFGLYALSDVLGAALSHPLYAALRRLARHVPALRWFGQRMMRFAMLGARTPRAEDIHSSGRIAPALFRIGTIGFGMDVYKAGMLVAGLPVPRVVGWSAAIAGDLVWFVILLGVSIATAAVVDDYRIQFVVMLVAMFVLPYVAKRLFPILRDPPPTTPVPATTRLETPPALGVGANGATHASGTSGTGVVPARAFASTARAAASATVHTPEIGETRAASVAASYLARPSSQTASAGSNGTLSRRSNGRTQPPRKAAKTGKKSRRR